MHYAFDNLFVGGPLLRKDLLSGNFLQQALKNKYSREDLVNMAPSSGELLMFFHALGVLHDALHVKVPPVKSYYVNMNRLGQFLHCVFQAYTQTTRLTLEQTDMVSHGSIANTMEHYIIFDPEAVFFKVLRTLRDGLPPHSHPSSLCGASQEPSFECHTGEEAVALLSESLSRECPGCSSNTYAV